MNLDRFNPLSMFGDRSKASQPQPNEVVPLNDSEFSDWGIDDTITADLKSPYTFPGPHPGNSIPYYNQPYANSRSFSFNSNGSFSSSKRVISSGKPRGDFYSNLQNYRANTELISQFISTYIRIDPIDRTLWEKFKYTLITSNLLDDSMILSKNEQSLSNLLQNNPSLKHDHVIANFRTNFDCNFNLILILINLIITLIKTSCNRNMLTVLLVLVLKLIRLHKLRLAILSNKNMNHLNQFLLSNYKINKHLISSLIQLKELHLYNGINGGLITDEDDLTRYKYNLKSNLLNSVYFLNSNLMNSINDLFHLINGDVFEQYVSINNINLGIISEQTKKFESPVDEAVYSINRFNQLRKLFICQLLSINEKNNKKNFFVYQLMDNFNLPEGIDTPKNLNDKLISISNIFTDQNKILQNFNLIFDKFSQTSKLVKQSHENEDILDVGKPENESPSDVNLVSLVEKLESLVTNFKYFHKYNQSTKSINNIDELNEKIMIFNQFNDELSKVKELYQLCANDLNNDIYLAQNCYLASSTEGSSMKSPQPERGEFSLKSFHNASIKKRFSLPASTGTQVDGLSSPVQRSDKQKDRNSTSSSGKKYKRLSAGLGLGLLTVVEEQSNSNSKTKSTKSSDSNGLPVSYDDNYINILPPQTYETYNQSTLDQLSNNTKAKKLSFSLRNSNRFSLNSMCSNVSGVTDLISSTQLTNYDDEQDDINDSNISKISKEELRLKLEESFSRIYNLENENKILKSNHQDIVEENESEKKVSFESTKELTNNNDKTEGPPENSAENDKVSKTLRKERSKSRIIDGSFLNELEQTLNKQTLEDVS